MISLKYWVRNGSPVQRAVIEKYGYDTLERAINHAQSEFWSFIYHRFLTGKRDNSTTDIDYVLAEAVLGYLYENDEALQSEMEE